MGIKNLSKFLKKKCKNGIQEISYKELNGKFIAIDTSIFLYKYSYMGNMIMFFFKQIEHLLKNNITPIYLFDGKPTEDKKETMDKRKETYQKNLENIENLEKKKQELINEFNLDDIKDQLLVIEEEIKKKTKNNVKVNFEEVMKFKEILKNLGIFYFDCDGETDCTIKTFFDKKLVDYVITEDLDFLTHGCEKVLRKYNYSKSKVELYDLNLILNDLKIEYDSFVDMCIIMGCDYYEKGIRNLGPVKAYTFIQKYLTLSNLLENETMYEADESFNYNNILSMFHCKKEIEITRDDLKIKRKELNEEFFKEYKIDKIFNLIKKFNYKEKVNILSFMKKK